jgi:hypothetical protein
MPLFRIIYFSRACAVTERDIETMLDAARARNESCGITGCLVFGDGLFLQALEGRRHKVNAVYQSITADHRHQGCILIQAGVIDARAFPSWPMVYCDIAQAPPLEIRRFMPDVVFDPASMTAATALGFLQSCAEAVLSQQPNAAAVDDLVAL